MRDRRTHIALTIDEYGNLAGLVTLEDLLEFIVGDIQDEFDTAQPLWRPEGPGTWVVRGSLPLERLARLTGKPVESAPDYVSVAGMLLEVAGRVPPVASRFQVGELVFEVVEATPAASTASVSPSRHQRRDHRRGRLAPARTQTRTRRVRVTVSAPRA